MAIVVASFAQMQPRKMYPVSNPISTSNERSSWKGDLNVDHFTEWEEDETYFIRLNQFANLQPGYTLDKVKFFWQDQGTVTDDNNNPIEVNFSPEFDVVIWTGGNANWIVQESSVANLGSAVYFTNDATNFGTQVFTQHYTASETGLQEVVLTTPYTVTGTEGEIWVGIHCCGYTCGGLGDEHCDVNTPWGNFLDYYYSTNENHPGWNLYVPLYYTDATKTEVKAAYTAITVWVNDGGAAEVINDWEVKVYNPADAAQYPTALTAEDYVEVDEFLDSIYFYCGIYNGGIDEATSDALADIYLVDNNGEHVAYWEQEALGVTPEDPLAANYGWKIGPMAVIGTDMFEEYNLSYPLQVCVSVTPVDATLDPDMSNNTACATYDFEHVGIANIEESSLSIFPNPACNVINVDNAAGAQISIYNIAGQEVMAIEAANANETINVASLSEGVYVIRVVNGNEVATGKVSIVR